MTDDILKMTPVGSRGSPTGDHCFSTAFQHIYAQRKLPETPTWMYYWIYGMVVRQTIMPDNSNGENHQM